MAPHVLVTGGAGYVGSHTCKALTAAGFTPVVYDDFRRGNRWAVRWGPLVEKPLEDRASLIEAMRAYKIVGVMHFAAYAYVGESMQAPSIYFTNNVANSINVLDAMVETRVERLVISSTCATYGVPPAIPITEQTPLAPTNPYGASKMMLEELARWYGVCFGLRSFALRYFNAAGADPGREIGELHDPELHLLPLVVDAALGRREYVQIHGSDYATRDGTAVRDYVHVTDLADAHVRAMRYLMEGGESTVANLGTGSGASVREVIAAVAKATRCQIEIREGPRRPGDPPELIADAMRAGSLLDWRPRLSELDRLAETAILWHRDILPGLIHG